MTRFFNTAGPNKPSQHFSIDPFKRVNWPELRTFIDQERYFILHAPRQTGKTTLLSAIVEHLNAEGKYEALYVNVETAQVARNDFETGNRLIVTQLIDEASLFIPDSWLAREGTQFLSVHSPGTTLGALLAQWAVHSAKPTVLVVDEIDSLIGDTLVFVLRQLRSGYKNRPRAFPQSVILCGVRDVRDYPIETSSGKSISGGSCFNIKAKSLKLGNFSEAEVRELYGQHKTETGQIFEEPVFSRVMQLSSLNSRRSFNLQAAARRTLRICPFVVSSAGEECGALRLTLTSAWQGCKIVCWASCDGSSRYSSWCF